LRLGVSGQLGEADIKVDEEIPADDEESLPPAARELRESNSSSELVLSTEVVSSHERLTNEKSVESVDLLTSADRRHRSVSPLLSVCLSNGDRVCDVTS